MFPHTVTLYNVEIEKKRNPDTLDIEEIITNYITVLRGVFMDASKASNVRESGLVGADAVNLYIPFNVRAEDGITGKKKQYISPTEFWKLDDKAGFWTLADNGNDFFVKDVVVWEDKNRTALELMYDHVYGITKIDEKDFGLLQHWEVGGN